MVDMGVSNRALDDIVFRMRKCPEVLGAKISGSGLGDCALALGTIDPHAMPYEMVSVQISGQGVRVE